MTLKDTRYMDWKRWWLDCCPFLDDEAVDGYWLLSSYREHADADVSAYARRVGADEEAYTLALDELDEALRGRLDGMEDGLEADDIRLWLSRRHGL